MRTSLWKAPYTVSVHKVKAN